MSEIDPRVPLASERTLLAWVRTGLAMMGFGFVIARFGLFLRELLVLSPQSVEAEPNSFWQRGSLWIGVGLVVAGGVVSLLAAVQHVRFMGQLLRGKTYRPQRLSLGVVVSLLIAVIGGVMAAYLIASSL